MKLNDYFTFLDKCSVIYISSRPFTLYTALDKRNLIRYDLNQHFGPSLLCEAADKGLTVCFEFKPGYYHTGPRDEICERDWWEHFNNPYKGNVEVKVK